MKTLDHLGRRLLSLLLCLAMVCPLVSGGMIARAEEQPQTDVAYTRADLEEAIVEMAWAYYLKGGKLQYCSQELTGGLSKYYGGTYRLTEDAAPEYGTSDTTVYSVCSDFVYKVYYEALGYRMFGSGDYLDAVTTAMWMFCEDVVLMRWLNDSYTLTEADLSYGVTMDHVMSLEEARAFLANWEENLRPGDVILPQGHAMLYIGNGYVVDCWGGKYSKTTGQEFFESEGGVHFLHRLEDLYLNGTDPVTTAYWLTENFSKSWFTVFRPLDFFLDTEDGDNNLGNDLLASDAVSLTDSVRSRLAYPGMEIDRTVDITPYGTAATGQTLTYTVDISNCTTDEDYLTYHQSLNAAYSGRNYSNLVVTETIPEGTVLSSGSITHGGVYNSFTNTITWNLNVAAGASVELSYQVIVTAPAGSTIVNDGGYVANIRSNSISNAVGGGKLSDEAQEALTELANTDLKLWGDGYQISKLGTDLQFAERIYAEAMGIELELPTVQEILDNLFTYQSITVSSGSIRYSGSQTAKLFTQKESVPEGYQSVSSMMVDGYLGGLKLYFAQRGQNINEFRMEYLEPGDILVYAAMDGSTVAYDKVMVCAGDSTLLTLDTDQQLVVLDGSNLEQNNSNPAFAELWKAYISDVFFVLRPSQVYTDINTLENDTNNDPEYDTEHPTADSTWGSSTLSAENLEKLAALTAAEGWSQANTAFAEEVYAELGIDITNATQSLTVVSLFKNVLFANIGTSSDYSYARLTDISEGYARLNAMLVPELRGGADMAYFEENTVAISDLKPGDVLYLIHRSDSRYWTGVYLGGGKILFSQCRSKGNTYLSYKVYDFSADTDGSNFAELLAADPIENVTWQCFLVLRPSQGYYDINDIDRAIPLDEANCWDLVHLADRYGDLTGNNTRFAVDVYERIGLDIGDIFPLNSNNVHATVNDIWSELFTADENETYIPNVSSAVYAPALVEALRGGSLMAEAENIKTDFDAADLEPGDILFQGDSTRSVYYVSVYLGEGQMLTRQYDKNTASNTKTLLHTFSGENAEVFADFLMYDAAGKTFPYYFVLRPCQAAENINALTIPTDSQGWEPLASAPSRWSDSVDIGFAEEIYNAVGLDIHGITGRTTVQSLLETLFIRDESGVYSLNAAADAAYAAALVANLRGGEGMDVDYNFTYTDLQVGDILCQADQTTGACYVSVYLGSEKFLTSKFNTKTLRCDGTMLYDFTPTGAHAGTFQYVLNKDPLNGGNLYDCYFVLRPAQAVLDSAELAYNLDWYYQERLEALAEDYSSLTEYNAAFADEVYHAVGLDLSEILTTTSTATLYSNLFADGSIRSSVSASYANAYTALVADLVGGSNMSSQNVFAYSDLLPGDILFQYYYTSSLAYYDVSVYLGSGLMLTRQYVKNADTKTGTTVLHNFTENGGFAEMLTLLPDSDTAFQAYFVLRPGQAGVNMNCQLEESNQEALLDLAEDYSTLTSNNAAFANGVYSAFGMDISQIITTTSTATMWNRLFTRDGSKYVLNTDCTEAYAAALVPELRGGSLMAASLDIRTGFSWGSLEAGDILFQYYYTSTFSCYDVSVYLGDGLMLTRQYVNDNGTKTGNTVLYDFSEGGADEGTFIQMLTILPNSETQFQGYFVLRPGQV